MKKTILSSLFPVAMLALGLSTAPVASGVDESFTFALGTPIPDGNPAGLASDKVAGAPDFNTSIVVITGLKVTLNIAGDPGGGFNGDLFAYLRHITPAGTGFSVLLNRVGRGTGVEPQLSYGYGDSGFNVTLDDLAANGDIHLYQTVTTPAAGTPLLGSWAPDARETDPDLVVTGDARTALLSSFIGKTPQGTWSFFIADMAGGSEMAITSWGLEISGIASTNWYWKGATDNLWTTIGTPALPNWTTDAAGTTIIPAVPFAVSDVIFSATGATNQNTVLGADFTIHSLTIADPAAVTIGGANTLTIAGNAGTGVDVQAGAGLLTIDANLTLAGASDTITVNNAAGAVINGTVGGTNGLIKTGTGVLTLSGMANSYSGGTTIAAGVLAISNDANLGNLAGGVTFTGVPPANGVLRTLAGITSARTMTLTQNGLFDSNGFDSTWNGQITGPGGLVKTGAGTLTLTNDANNYATGTALGGGTLAVSSDAQLGSGPLQFDGGTLEALASFSSAKTVGLAPFVTNPGGAGTGNGTIEVDPTFTLTLSGPVIGPGSLTKTGTGVLTLSGMANSYSGGTTIAAGVLAISNDANLGNLAGGVTFTGVPPANGVLRTLAGITSARTMTLTQNGLFDSNGFDSTWNGQITGPGGLVKTGAGTLTLTNDANNYATGTALGGGTLAVSSDAQLGSGPLQFDGGTLEALASFSSAKTVFLTPFAVNPGGAGTGNGTIQVDPTFALTLSGQVTGGGSLTKTGAGTLTLSGLTNSYAGGTTIAAGVLAISSDANLGDPAGGVTFTGVPPANGVLRTLAAASFDAARTMTLAQNGIFDSNGFDSTWNGQVTGPGGLIKTGAGTLTLTNNANDYAGPTGFGGGTLAVSTDAQLGSGGLSFDGGTLEALASFSSAKPVGLSAFAFNPGGAGTGSGTIQVDPTFTLTLTGPVAGPGSLTKTGAGTLALTNANTYTGGTTLNAGTLAAGNAKALGSGNFTMNGGTLRTTGGPLAVDIGAGNILFSGGTFAANVGGTTAGVLHDQLRTTGSANTGGGTFALTQQNGFTLTPGAQVVLVSAAGGVAGGSANGTAVPGSQVTGLSAFSNTPLLVPVVNLYTTSVVLEAMQGSFATATSQLSGFTFNQIMVARALDSAAAARGNKTGIFQELDFLDTQPLTKLLGYLDEIAPEKLTAVFTNAVALANIQTANIQRRTEDLRSKSPAASASGMAAAGTGPSYSGGVAGPTGKRSKEIAPPDQERWGMFLTGSGEFTRVGSTTNAAGFDLETGGVTGGIDYRVTDNFAIGLDFGYMNTTSGLANGGSIKTDGGRLGIYGTYFDRGFYVDAAVNGGLNSYKTRRTTPNTTSATGSPDGSEINILLATGYDWKLGGLTVGPTASYQYTNVRMDGFTETGAFAPLTVNGQSVESSRIAFGVKATYDLPIGGVLVRPEVKLAWQHECGDSTYSITSRFSTLGGNAFTVFGPETGRDSLLVGAGLSILWTPRLATYVYYDGELLRTNYSSHSISAGFRWQF